MEKFENGLDSDELDFGQPRPAAAPGSDEIPDSVFDPPPLPQNFDAEVGVSQVLSISLERPPNQSFFRVHPAFDQFDVTHPLIELKAPTRFKDLYWVVPELRRELESELSWWRLFPAITRDGQMYLWPIQDSNWGAPAEALDAARMAVTRWVRLSFNQKTKHYEPRVSDQIKSEPAWPEWDSRAWLKRAFAGRIVRDFGHPVLRNLRGE